jgi:hypothetical protein
MRLNCGPTAREKNEAKKQWHLVFAWLPKRVGPRDCRWLELVERKGTWHRPPPIGLAVSGWWTWEYRAFEGAH